MTFILISTPAAERAPDLTLLLAHMHDAGHERMHGCKWEAPSLAKVLEFVVGIQPV
jgi:hypothetical protein